jgi:isopentenyl-diphosphate delta-isomerase
MGFECGLHRACDFVYRRDLAEGLVEHEFDHVFSGQFDGAPAPNAGEVDAWRWADVEEVRADSDARPERYTAWFGLALERLLITRRGAS